MIQMEQGDFVVVRFGSHGHQLARVAKINGDCVDVHKWTERGRKWTGMVKVDAERIVLNLEREQSRLWTRVMTRAKRALPPGWM